MKRIIITMLKSIPFILFWLIMLIVISATEREGILSVYGDALGDKIYILLSVLIFLAVTSIIYLRFIVKKEWLIQLISFTFSIILILGCVCLSEICEKRFSDFSTENWANFPSRRGTMLADFKMKYNIVGYSKEDIINLLGKPDEVLYDFKKGNTFTDVFVYDDRYGNTFDVYFLDDYVISFSYTE